MAIALPTAPEAAPAPRSSALIQLGWGMPTPDKMLKTAPALERLPFDGIAVALHPGLEAFLKTAFSDEAFAQDRADLRAFRSQHLTRNFVMVWATTETGWDWANNGDWQAAEQNVLNMVRTAKAGNLAGIILDAECYGPSPWDYSKLQPGGHDFGGYAKIVYARGQELIRRIEAEFPQITILLPWGPVSVMDRTHEPPPGAARTVFLAQSGYGLYPSFLRGMLDASVDAHFVDGDEASYYYLTDSDFGQATDRLRGLIRSEVAKTSGPGHAKRYQLGQAGYADYILDPADNPGTIGHYLANRKERLRVLHMAVSEAAAHSDGYVWIYSEKVDWWREPYPDDAMHAIRDAWESALSGAPPDTGATDLVTQARDAMRRATGH